MIVARDLAPAQLDSILGRTSPVLKFVIAVIWFVGLATTIRAMPPVAISAVAAAAGLTIGRIPAADLARAVAFIDRAAEIGCDAVKFQLFKIDEMFAPEILAPAGDPESFRAALASEADAVGLSGSSP